MRTLRGRGAAGLGTLVLGFLGALAHCGGGSSSSPPPGDDSGPSGHDATADDGSVAPDGADATLPDDGEADATDGRTGDDGQADAGGDARGGGADAGDGGPGPLDSGSDAADGAPRDAGPDAIADAAPPGPPCDAQASCSADAATVMCCSGYCVDTARDPANCGQCGNGCTANQFCTGTKCDNAVIANVCANARGTVALDPYAVDNEAGAAIGAALSTICTPPTSIVVSDQNALGILDINGSGRPITGPGNTFITGGGYYGQSGVEYMENVAAISPLRLTGDGTNEQIRTRDGTAIEDVVMNSLTAHYDFFYVQLSIEPRSGTLCFSGAGMLGPGTQAAGYFVSTEMIPNRANYPSSWYVYRWDDTNNDSIANAGDMFTPIMAGP